MQILEGKAKVSYDDTQIGAKLIKCAGCGKVSYNTNPDPKCAKCRKEKGVKEKLTADEFERQYAERSCVTVEFLRKQGRIVVSCDCDYDGCRGWRSVYRHHVETTKHSNSRQSDTKKT